MHWISNVFCIYRSVLHLHKIVFDDQRSKLYLTFEGDACLQLILYDLFMRTHILWSAYSLCVHRYVMDWSWSSNLMQENEYTICEMNVHRFSKKEKLLSIYDESIRQMIDEQIPYIPRYDWWIGSKIKNQ